MTNLGELTGGAVADAGAADAPFDVAALDGATTTDAPTEGAPDAGPTFRDDFARDDGTIGNGWLLRRTPGCFGIRGGELLRSAQTPDAGTDSYVDCLIYRPASEDLLNVEASVIVRFKDTPQGWPQIHARIQKGTVGTAGMLDSYFFFLNRSSGFFELGHVHGAAAFDVFATFAANPALDSTTPVRLTLRVTGTGPVKLVGTLDRFVNGQWLQSGQVAHDEDAASIPVAGSVGLSSGAAKDEATSNYAYDDFTRTPL